MRYSIALLGLVMTACPAKEKPPCDEATLTTLAATCPNKAECDRLIEQRERDCATTIKGESK